MCFFLLSKQSIECIRIFFALRSKFFSLLASLYALTPLTLTAENLGGICSICPKNSGNTFLISSKSGIRSELFIVLPFISSVSFDSPKVISKSYVFSELKYFILFVASPRAMAKTPVANGSRVPE